MFFYYLTLTLFKTTIAAIIFVLTSCINGMFLINTTKRNRFITEFFSEDFRIVSQLRFYKQSQGRY